MSTFKIESGNVLITGNDGRYKLNSQFAIPHIISSHWWQFSFPGAKFYNKAANADVNLGSGNFTIYTHHIAAQESMSQFRTLSNYDISECFLIVFARVTPVGGHGLNNGVINKWINVQGSLVTRAWGSQAINKVPNGFGGGEAYSFEIDQKHFFRITRTLICGNWYDRDQAASVLGADYNNVRYALGAEYYWPSEPRAQYASTIEVKVFLCRAGA